MNNLTGRFRKAADYAGIPYFEALAQAEREWIDDTLVKSGLGEDAPARYRQLSALAEFLGLSFIDTVAEARQAWVIRQETAMARDEALSFAG